MRHGEKPAAGFRPMPFTLGIVLLGLPVGWALWDIFEGRNLP